MLTNNLSIMSFTYVSAPHTSTGFYTQLHTKNNTLKSEKRKWLEMKRKKTKGIISFSHFFFLHPLQDNFKIKLEKKYILKFDRVFFSLY